MHCINNDTTVTNMYFIHINNDTAVLNRHLYNTVTHIQVHRIDNDTGVTIITSSINMFTSRDFHNENNNEKQLKTFLWDIQYSSMS